MDDVKLKPVAVVRSCYKEKFGIPRQSGLSETAEAFIELLAPFNHEDYIRELEGFSHIWLIFVFHQHLDKESKPTVRPPRLGGNKRVGVFASRSPFRPNPLGLSVVKLKKVSRTGSEIRLHVTGADLLDGTPVVDIKPYVNYVDSIPQAISSYAGSRPEKVLAVCFSAQAQEFMETVKSVYPEFEKLIKETIGLDPRPAYNDSSKVYGLCLYDVNIKWSVNADKAEVILIEKIS